MRNPNIIHKLISCKKTLLGVGPMSKNVIDATIELSDYYKVPLILIASRRQIDSDYHGGGYVCNWSTEEFSKYVKKNQRKNLPLWLEITEVRGRILLKLKKN